MYIVGSYQDEGNMYNIIVGSYQDEGNMYIVGSYQDEGNMYIVGSYRDEGNSCVQRTSCIFFSNKNFTVAHNKVAIRSQP